MAFQTDIKSTEQYKHEVLGTPGTLQVLECYNDWAGPCKPIQATLKALYFSLSDRPLKFYTVSYFKALTAAATNFQAHQLLVVAAVCCPTLHACARWATACC
jgi:hypothetical protein